jgi:PAS domain S-box-containing protein
MGIEDKFRIMVDAIPTLAWCNLPDGSNEFLNQRWHDYMGHSPEESHGWGWKAAIHREDLERLLDKWRALLASGEPGEIEARLRRYDGEYRWFLFQVEPFRDELGNILKWFGTNTDIGNLKRTELLLAAEKQTLEMISSGAPLADILTDLSSTSTVLLMDSDGERLLPGAGPADPDGWIRAITPLTIGPCTGFVRHRCISEEAGDQFRHRQRFYMG